MRLLIRSIVLVAGLLLGAAPGAQEDADRSYGPVKRNDTVSALARRFRGDADLTLNQVMIAVARANPEAFRDGNINGLRQRVTLRIPTVEEMAAITPEAATAAVGRHHEAWRNRRERGSAVPAPAPDAPAVAPARTQPAAPATPPPAPTSPPASAEVSASEVAEYARALAEANTVIEELRDRIAERDQVIEALLAQLAQPDTGAESAATSDFDAAAESKDGESSMADRLPVNPLVLGSALIVLLILVVVVTLLRRREEEGSEYAEEVEEEEEAEFKPAGAEVATQDGEGARTRSAAVGAGSAADVPPVLETGIDYRALDGVPAADDEVELPIGLDLEDERDPEYEPGSALASELEETIDPRAFRRDVDVGALDDLEIDPRADAGAGAAPDVVEERERSRRLRGARDPAPPGG